MDFLLLGRKKTPTKLKPCAEVLPKTKEEQAQKLI